MQTDQSLCLMIAKIPIKKDSGPAKVTIIERIVVSIKNKRLLVMTAGFPFTTTAIRSENAVSATKEMPNPTDHFPKRVFGTKSIFIY